MQNYIIAAQSILDSGLLGHVKEAQMIAALSSTEALAAFQWETLRGKGSYLNEDHDTLHYGGMQFTAMTQDEFFDAQGDEDELDGIEDFDCLEDLLDLAYDPIDERLARLKEVGR